jgi:hypothetical protein
VCAAQDIGASIAVHRVLHKLCPSCVELDRRPLFHDSQRATLTVGYAYLYSATLSHVYMLAYLFRNQMIDRQKEMVLPITDDRLAASAKPQTYGRVLQRLYKGQQTRNI